MTWSEVPAKLAQYDAEEYAPANASYALLRSFGVDAYTDIPVAHREEFEAQLDYRLGACINLRNSRAVRPKR